MTLILSAYLLWNPNNDLMADVAVLTPECGGDAQAYCVATGCSPPGWKYLCAKLSCQNCDILSDITFGFINACIPLTWSCYTNER